MSGCGAEHGLISIDQALSLIQQHTQVLGTEHINLNAVLNRYLAEDVYSSINLPLFSQSAVDGYAIHADDVIEADSIFELIGEIRAGQTVDFALQMGQGLQRGQAVRIFTGAPTPSGTTTVARQEIVELLSTSKIQITETLKKHADIRDIGEEISIGQCLAEKGQKLSVGAIAALSMAGIRQVQVFQYPKVAVVITGDEVAQTFEDFAAGMIFDANAPLIEAWFAQQHYRVKIFHVADSEQAVSDLFNTLKDHYDVIISTGGVSVGDYDFVRPVALNIGFEQVFWKVKQKPGKPMLFAQYLRNNTNPCYLLGLPGNPAAVYVGMQIYVKTLLDALQGQIKGPNWFSAVISHEVKVDARERFLRMHAQFEQGTLTLTSLKKQQSHMLSNLMHANCLVRIPAEQVIHRGHVLHGIFITDFV